MLTVKVTRNKGGWLRRIDGRPPSERLAQLRIPPAWTAVQVDPSPSAVVLATGLDAAGRKQRLYSPEHVASAKAGKFARVRALLTEWEDIRTQIEANLNDPDATTLTKEAALVAYLIYETGIRPGSARETLAAVKAYGAATLQLRHCKPCTRGVRLRFSGKKGVRQNILVTNPYLVRVMLKRKRANAASSTMLFDVSGSALRGYFRTLGSGDYSPKDFRTARGTALALELLGTRKRLPRAASCRKRVVNRALDRVARMLGNTRAVSRSAYVDPVILERFLT